MRERKGARARRQRSRMCCRCEKLTTCRVHRHQLPSIFAERLKPCRSRMAPREAAAVTPCQKSPRKESCFTQARPTTHPHAHTAGGQFPGKTSANALWREEVLYNLGLQHLLQGRNEQAFGCLRVRSSFSLPPRTHRHDQALGCLRLEVRGSVLPTTNLGGGGHAKLRSGRSFNLVCDSRRQAF